VQRVRDYILTISFGYILYCRCLNVCLQCVGVCMCGFCNILVFWLIYVLVFTVFLLFCLCIFILICFVRTSVRTTATV
jgi:hypothetical protein